MLMTVTTLPNERNFVAKRRIKAEAEILIPGSGDTKYEGQFVPVPEITVESVLLKTGKDPSEAVLSIPFGIVTAVAGPRTRLHKTYVIRNKTGLSPIAPAAGSRNLSLYTKVAIFYSNFTIIGQGDRGGSFLIFVGYVSALQVTEDQKNRSILSIRCKDARWLMSKIPAMGIIHADRDVGFGTVSRNNKSTFIKNATIPFNEGNHPNMFYDPFDGKGTWYKRPKFIEPDFGRFTDELITLPSGKQIPANEYIEDAAIEDPASFGLTAANFPVARQWLAGPVYNYFANMCNCSSEAINDDLTGFDTGTPALWDDPASVTVDEVSISLKNEVFIPILHPAAQGSKIMGSDWFRPRSQVGAQVLSGQQSIVSSVGIYNPFGSVSVIDLMQDLCYRLGNYTLAATYDLSRGTGAMVLHVIRTTSAFDEDADIKVGLNSSNKIEIVISGEETGTTKPDVHTFNLKISADNLHNTYTTRGGRHWTQMTFLTLGTSPNLDQAEQNHPAYNPVGVSELIPRTPYMTLQPGWNFDQQKEYVELATAEQGQAELYPDVFRVWIISPEINWPDMWGTVPNPIGGPNQARGLIRNFRRARQLLPVLISSYYEKVLGAWRSRRTQLPIMVFRSFRGIRTDPDGNTRFGDDTTENDPPVGNSDWFYVQSPPELIGDDGRFGIKFAPGARFPVAGNFFFEAGDKGKARSPLTWNGVIEDEPNENRSARAYDIMLTVAVPSDEELFDYLTQTNNGIIIAKHGFRSERVQDAGTEFQQEQTINSILYFPKPPAVNPQQPFRLDPPQASPRRVYVDGQKELTARNHMMANKFAKPDIDGNLNFLGILPSLKAGHYVGEFLQLEGKGAKAPIKTLPVNSILTSVIHDFSDIQQTTVEFGTIR